MNPVEPVYHLSDPTANALPKANTSADRRLIDSKLADTGSDLLYDGTSLLGEGTVLRAQQHYTPVSTNWTAPRGCTEVWVKVWVTGSGGGGGGGYQTGSSTAGKDGYVTIEWNE